MPACNVVQGQVDFVTLCMPDMRDAHGVASLAMPLLKFALAALPLLVGLTQIGTNLRAVNDVTSNHPD